jgi:hypothetical protein
VTTYNWQFVESGRERKKLTMYLCIGKSVYCDFKDINIASQAENQILERGDKIQGQTIDDLLTDMKNKAESVWNSGRLKPLLTRRLDQKSFKEFLKSKK